MKIKCLTCGRQIGCQVPKGGDGSAVRVQSHYPTKERRGPTGGGSALPHCKGSNQLITGSA